MVFNRDKFVFAAKTVDFAGFEMNDTGFHPAKYLNDTIKNFPSPQTATDIRAFWNSQSSQSF